MHKLSSPDWKLTVATIATTLLPMIDYYGRSFFAENAYNRFAYYFIVPMILLWLMGWHPRDHGLRLGKWREGVLWVIGVGAIMGIFLWFFARTPEMQSYYADVVTGKGGIGRAIFLTGIDLFGWEFIWRGFLLFIYTRYFGFRAAVFLHAVPFAFMHLGKPEWETYSTIFGGAGFGLIAWRTRSMLYPWLIHWFIASLTLFVAVSA